MTPGTRDWGMTFAARIAILCISLGTQSCLAWFLAPSGRGSYAICLVFAALLRVVFVVGCGSASMYFVSSKRFSISEGITYTLIYGGIGSGLAIAAGLVLMQLRLSFFEKATPTAFYLALFLIPTSLYALIFMRLLTSVREFGCFAIMSIMHGVVQLLSAMVFVGALSWGVNGALLAILMGDIVAITSTLIFFKQKYGITMEPPSIVNLWDMLNYGARYYIGKISNQTSIKAGMLILAFFTGRKEIGLFAVASQFTFQATLIPDTISTVLMPRVAGDKAGKRELVAQCFRLTAVACGMLLLIIAVFARPVVTILFSAKFLPAVPLIQILSIGVAVRCASKIFEPYLLGTDHPGIASISVAIGTFVNLIVLWWLLPFIGLPAAALGIVAGYLTSSTLLTIGFIRLSGLGARQTLQFGQSDWAAVSNIIRRVRRKFF